MTFKFSYCYHGIVIHWKLVDMNWISLLVSSIICVLVIKHETFKKRDFLSPISWFCISKMMLINLSGIFIYINQFTFKRLPIYMPQVKEDLKSFRLTSEINLINTFVFVCSYYLCYNFFKISKYKTAIHCELIPNRSYFVQYFFLLGIVGSFGLLSLAPYNFFSNGAYYHMAGFGWANWLVSFFAIHLCLFYLSSKSTRLLGYILAGFSLLIYGWLLGRGTNTISILLLILIVVCNPIKNKFPKPLLFSIATLPIVAVFIMKYFDYKSVHLLLRNMFAIFAYDVGRFEVFQTALYYHHPGKDLPWWTIYKIIPFRGILPIVKDFNMVFEKISETWMTGHYNPEAGGVGFPALAEIFLAYGKLGVVLLSMFWGLVWAWIYNIMENSYRFFRGKENHLIGVYAIIWMENSDAVYPILQQGLIAFGFLFLFGKLKIVSQIEAKFL